MIHVACCLLFVLASCAKDQSMKAKTAQTTISAVRRPKLQWGRSVGYNTSQLATELVHLEFDAPQSLTLFLNDPQYQFRYPNTNEFEIITGNGSTASSYRTIGSIRGSALNISAKTLIVRSETKPATIDQANPFTPDANVRVAASAALGSPVASTRGRHLGVFQTDVTIAAGAFKFVPLSAWSTHAQALITALGHPLTHAQLLEAVDVSEVCQVSKNGVTWTGLTTGEAPASAWQTPRALAAMTNTLRLHNTTAAEVYLSIAETFFQ